ncbi:hypothetical protein [Oceanobacillus jeddahense]|uniref:Antigen I/II N-terminal domain-containing protein n=1 Tax=Oceanobacillus jeddahense TaxID=1462527 RepID=A0ABY5JWZ2_9BACI|nr:hypothetical protein [Oceanobacillus jeddahense]UUI03084.1 hypothetical protein NP439_24160 [Oceanobacillus jeddahense]
MWKHILVVFLSAIIILSGCANDTVENENSSSDSEKDNMVEDSNDEEKENQESNSNESSEEEFDEVIHIEKELLDKGVPRRGVNDILSGRELEYERHDDESYTYKLTTQELEEIKEEVERGIEEDIVKEFADSEEMVSLHEIEVNEPYTKFTLIVDEDVYKDTRDAFAAYALSISSLFWQALEGKDLDSYEVQVDMKDAESGEIFESVNYLEEDINYYD